MNKRFNISNLLLTEALVWFFILCVLLFSVRFYIRHQHKKLHHYQIFLNDIDGLIEGSPVKYMGVNIGYVSYIKLLSNEVYVKFIVTQKNFELPKGVVAQVEFNGMGGTKSLELYPPTKEDLLTGKIINTSDTYRISSAISLFKQMISKFDTIGGRVSLFMKNMLPLLENNETQSTLQTFADEVRRSDDNLKKYMKEVYDE